MELNLSRAERDPFRSFRFRVRMGGSGYMDGGATTVAAFSRCSGIRAVNRVLKMRSGVDARGVQGIIPTIVEYSNVTLSRGVVADNSFLDWVFDCMPGYESGPTNPQRRTIDIVVLDETGKEAITWTLFGAYPVAYELTTLDASRDEVLMENLEFAYSGLKRSIN